ncbi:MAG: RNA polymerase sigma factor [Saprospiraceae bacterium]
MAHDSIILHPVIQLLSEKQFEALYHEYKNLVYNLALHYIQQKESAEDITQEVFVKIYRQYHRYDPAAASLKTWIYRITINHCLDVIKAGKTKRRFARVISLFQSDTSSDVMPDRHFSHPGIEAEDKAALEALFKLINELPDTQKTALILSKIEGHPHKEIAEIMDTTVKAVESLIQRDKTTLAKKIKSSA